jgi:ATP-dependent Clp protease adaptor protein ClpS
VSVSVGSPVVGGADRSTGVRPVASAAPTTAPVVDVEVRESLDPLWDVVVWDDPVNLMSYVVLVLRRVLGHPLERARRLMLQVHHEGRAVVATERLEQAEHHVALLHAHGLHATIEPTA